VFVLKAIRTIEHKKYYKNMDDKDQMLTEEWQNKRK